MKKPLLVVMGGLPGSGKTTLSRLLAAHLKGVYIRVDTLEQTLRNANVPEVGPEGYMLAYAVAEDNLRIGNIVIADSVNPLLITRKAWQDIAARNAANIIEIEILCSDPNEHKRRVEARQADIPGHKMPTWQNVLEHEYHPWHTKHITVDTAEAKAEIAFEILIKQLESYVEKS